MSRANTCQYAYCHASYCRERGLDYWAPPVRLSTLTVTNTITEKNMRTKIKATEMKIPTGNFTQKELSSLNGKSNSQIWNQMFELIADGTIVPAGFEKRSLKGKPARVYRYVADPSSRVKGPQYIVPSLQSRLTNMALVVRSKFWEAMGEPAPEMVTQPTS